MDCYIFQKCLYADGKQIRSKVLIKLRTQDPGAGSQKPGPYKTEPLKTGTPQI